MSITTGFLSLINERLASNENQAKISRNLARFELVKPLPLRLEAFVDHILYHLSLTETYLVNAFVIIERVFEYISHYNIHRMLFVAISLSYKFLTDSPASNRALEKIGLLKPGELFRLEGDLLKLVDWNINHSLYETTLEKLLEVKIIDVVDEEESSEMEDYDTNYTEVGSVESFSELGAFFNV